MDWSIVVNEAQAAVEDERAYRFHWRTVKAKVGREALSESDRAALMDQLADRGLTMIPPVDVTIPDGNEFVKVIRSDQAPEHLRLRFLAEKDLEVAIAKAMPAVYELAGVQLVGRQFIVHGGKKIDILGRRKLPKGRWRWVIIEVERGDGKGESARQLMDYANRLKKTKRAKSDGPLVGPNDEIELIVISQDGDEVGAKILRASAKENGYDSRWLVARIHLEEA